MCRCCEENRPCTHHRSSSLRLTMQHPSKHLPIQNKTCRKRFLKKKSKKQQKLTETFNRIFAKPQRNYLVKSPDPKKREKEKPVTDNQPTGSDNPIRQHNKFSTLDGMMEAEESPSCIPKGTLSRVPTT